LPELSWDTLKDYISRGMMRRATVPEQTLTAGQYLHVTLANCSVPSISSCGLWVYRIDPIVDKAMWAQVHTKVPHSMAGVSAVVPANFVPQNTSITRASVSYMVNTISGASLFVTTSLNAILFDKLYLAPVWERRVGDSFSSNEYQTRNNLIALGMGSTIALSIGPAVFPEDVASANTAKVNVSITWWEAGGSITTK
jgi:hypothetical protein